MLQFDSTDSDDVDAGCYYGAVRATCDGEGGNSDTTILEFETPDGFAQSMEVTVLTSDSPNQGNVFRIPNVHTVRVKITGAWEGNDIKSGLADLISAFKLKTILE